jgi:2-polyprenyl-3-methyl-5-hydroxy-6-metoxy-1,4-benzoquinol methylase
MSLGGAVRRAFGPLERPVAEAYRRIFVDLDALVARVRTWAPAPARILEIGCGEGAVTERLARSYPEAAILAIDVSPSVGRLFRGHRPNVEIRQTTLEGVVAREPHTFDLVLLCDVLHHVPWEARGRLTVGFL